MLKFERRDGILVAGLLMFMIGLIPFTGVAYAVIIVCLMYLGIKVYVEKKKQSIARDVGEGICMECGSKISGNQCPNCDHALE